jgi:hypothetical protein
VGLDAVLTSEDRSRLTFLNSVATDIQGQFVEDAGSGQPRALSCLAMGYSVDLLTIICLWCGRRKRKLAISIKDFWRWQAELILAFRSREEILPPGPSGALRRRPGLWGRMRSRLFGSRRARAAHDAQVSPPDFYGRAMDSVVEKESVEEASLRDLGLAAEPPAGLTTDIGTGPPPSADGLVTIRFEILLLDSLKTIPIDSDFSMPEGCILRNQDLTRVFPLFETKVRAITGSPYRLSKLPECWRQNVERGEPILLTASISEVV